MKKDGYYSSGQFADRAHITKKTIRYYDEHDILKPSFVTSYGARFYTDADFARLQQILLLKYLGFSLEDIREITINDSDPHFLSDSLKMQLKLVEDRIEQLQLVAASIQETLKIIQDRHTVDWNQIINLIHLTELEKSLKNQYQNATNLSARINLHHLYSQNSESWFDWIFRQLQLSPHMNVLEIGCGDGTLWMEHLSDIPDTVKITLSDRSEGMLRDARRRLASQNNCFTFENFDCQKIPHQDAAFDLAIANHVLFYCEDIPAACREIQRVLNSSGTLVCSTYGDRHMKQVNELVSAFDDRIVLSADRLFDRFGRENGASVLSPCFSSVTWVPYEDTLLVTESEPLISYILSCHGNQKQYIMNRYKEFCAYVQKKVSDGFSITKDAGIFICRKS